MDPLALEESASRAYQAFCNSVVAWMPMFAPDWSQLPDAVKTAWKAAANAVLKSK